MILKYRRNAAITGLASVGLFALAPWVRRFFTRPDAVIFVLLFAAAGLFIFGSYSLIKAKGHTSAFLLVIVPFLCFGPIAILAVLAVTVALPDRYPQTAARNAARRPGARKRSSPLERHVGYRKNALIALYFGLPTMVFGVALAMFRWGLFEQHSREIALGMFVLLAGYGIVLLGCHWWLKAKGWDSAVLLIGMLPVVGVIIPFVRRLFIRELWPGIVFMPIVLIVVIFSLPDRSGFSR